MIVLNSASLCRLVSYLDVGLGAGPRYALDGITPSHTSTQRTPGVVSQSALIGGAGERAPHGCEGAVSPHSMCSCFVHGGALSVSIPCKISVRVRIRTFSDLKQSKTEHGHVRLQMQSMVGLLLPNLYTIWSIFLHVDSRKGTNQSNRYTWVSLSEPP